MKNRNFYLCQPVWGGFLACDCIIPLTIRGKFGVVWCWSWIWYFATVGESHMCTWLSHSPINFDHWLWVITPSLCQIFFGKLCWELKLHIFSESEFSVWSMKSYVVHYLQEIISIFRSLSLEKKNLWSNMNLNPQRFMYPGTEKWVVDKSSCTHSKKIRAKRNMVKKLRRMRIGG